MVKKQSVKMFTETRSPYKCYQLAPWKWSDVFVYIDNIRNGNKQAADIVTNCPNKKKNEKVERKTTRKTEIQTTTTKTTTIITTTTVTTTITTKTITKTPKNTNEHGSDDDKNNPCDNYIKVACKEYGIEEETLRKKYSAYCKDPSIDFDTEKRGGSNKLFTQEQEQELFNHIMHVYINKNRPLNNNILKEIALKKYNETAEIKKENLSNMWCRRFKKEWK